MALAGFQGREDLELMLEPVFGVRQWSRDEKTGLLTGVHNYAWRDGENVAVCERGHRVPHSADTDLRTQLQRERSQLHAEMQRLGTLRPKGVADLPDHHQRRYKAMVARADELTTKLQDDPRFADCACGFYAYWDLNPSEFRIGNKPIVGVIRGYGKVALGTRGFRCEKAAIVGLHLAYEFIKPKVRPGREAEEPTPWSAAYAASYETDSPQGLAALAADEAELGARYPSATVYTTLDAMLAKHPPTREYAEADS